MCSPIEFLLLGANVKHAMRLNGVFIEMKCLFVYRDAIILWSLHAVCHMHMFIQPEGFYVLLCYFAVFVTQWKPLITTHPGLAKGVISDDIWPLINSIFFQFTCHVSETVTTIWPISLRAYMYAKNATISVYTYYNNTEVSVIWNTSSIISFNERLYEFYIVQSFLLPRDFF